MDILSILKTVAPWIATAITGPLGGIAIDAACSAIGVSEKTEKGLKQALAGVTQEQILALKTADQAFAVKMQELGYAQVKDLENIAADDRKDARNLLVQVKSWVPAVLSLVVTLGFFGLLFGMMLGDFKVADNQALLMMLGSLGTAWTTITAFWFGTTSTSERKTEIIAQSPAITK